ncbi:hypothetical protein KEM56_006278 [Ascosphaera pollenicola]|nr:hypothetical protein KEM56_006278 [Ascosphaera pollenicola]
MDVRSPSSSPDPLGLPDDTAHLLQSPRRSLTSTAAQTYARTSTSISPTANRKRTATSSRRSGPSRAQRKQTPARPTRTSTQRPNSKNISMATRTMLDELSVPVPLTPRPVGYRVRASSPLKNVVSLDDSFSSVHNETTDAPAQDHDENTSPRYDTRRRSARDSRGKITLVPLNDGDESPAHTPKRRRRDGGLIRRAPTPAAKGVHEDEPSDVDATPKQPKQRTRLGTPVPQTFFDSPKQHGDDEDDATEEEEEEDLPAQPTHSLSLSDPFFDIAGDGNSSDDVPEAPSIREIDDDEESLDDPFGLPDDLDQADIHQTPAMPPIRTIQRAHSSSPSKTPAARHSKFPERTNNAGHTPASKVRTYPSPTTSSLEDLEEGEEDQALQKPSELPFVDEVKRTEIVPLRRVNDPTSIHREFDSIMESEGFSMVSLDTLPSAKQHLGNSTLHARPHRASSRFLPPHLRQSLLHSPRPNSSIGYKVPPQLEDGDEAPSIHGTPDRSAPNSLLSRPPLRLQIDCGDGKRLFTNDTEQSPVHETSKSPVEGDGQEAPVPKPPARTLLQRVVRAIRIGIALQDALIYSKHFRDTRQNLDLLFQAYDGEIRWTLRTGLKFGVAMARRRREERERQLQKEREEKRRREEEERREEKQKEKERQQREEEERRRKLEAVRQEEEDRRREEAERIRMKEERAKEEERRLNEEMEEKRRLQEEQEEKERIREEERIRQDMQEKARKAQAMELRRREEEQHRLEQYQKEQDARLREETEKQRRIDEERPRAEEELRRREQRDKQREREERQRQEEQARRKEEMERKEEANRLQREKNSEVRRQREAQQHQEQERELQRIKLSQQKEEERREQQRQYEAQLWKDREEERKRAEEDEKRIRALEENESQDADDAVKYPDISKMQAQLSSPSTVRETSQSFNRSGKPGHHKAEPAATEEKQESVKYPTIDFSDLDVDQTIVPKAQRATTVRTPNAHKKFLNSGLFSSSPASENAAPSPAVGETTTILEERMRKEMAKREEEWQLEREAVSKQISDANKSQVIIVDSEDEAGAQDTEPGKGHDHDVMNGDAASEHSYEADDDEQQEDAIQHHEAQKENSVDEDGDDDMDIWQEAAHEKRRSRNDSRLPNTNGDARQGPQSPPDKSSPIAYNWRRKTARRKGFEYMSPPKTKTAIDRLREHEVTKLLGTPPSAVKRYYRQHGATPIKHIIVDQEGQVVDTSNQKDDEGDEHEGDDVLDEASLVYAKADEFDGQQRAEDAAGYENVKEISPKSDVAVGGQILATPAWLKPRRPLFTQTPVVGRRELRPQKTQEPLHQDEEHLSKGHVYDPETDDKPKDADDDEEDYFQLFPEDKPQVQLQPPRGEVHEQAAAEEELHSPAIEGPKDSPGFDDIEENMIDHHATPFIHPKRRIPLQEFSPEPSPQKPPRRKPTSPRKRKTKKKLVPKSKSSKHQNSREKAKRVTEAPPPPPNPVQKPLSWFERLTSLAPTWLRGSLGNDDTAVGTSRKHGRDVDAQQAAVPDKPTSKPSQKKVDAVPKVRQNVPTEPIPLQSDEKIVGAIESNKRRTGHPEKKSHRKKRKSSLPRKPLSTSGYFTDDHYYALRTMYRSAKSDPANFLYVPSPAKDALLGQSITSSDGSRSRPITKLQIAVVERFREYLSEQSTKRGGSGIVGWSDIELLNYLFTIIVGAEIRMERKKAFWEKRKRSGDFIA